MTAESQRILATNVNIAGVWYQAGTTPPPEVAEQITNPDAWVDGGVGEQPGGRAAAAGTSDGRRLRTRVHVGGVWYGPDDAVPDQVAQQITNPKAWQDPPGGGHREGTGLAQVRVSAGGDLDGAQPPGGEAPDGETPEDGVGHPDVDAGEPDTATADEADAAEPPGEGGHRARGRRRTT